MNDVNLPMARYFPIAYNKKFEIWTYIREDDGRYYANKIIDTPFLGYWRSKTEALKIIDLFKNLRPGFQFFYSSRGNFTRAHLIEFKLVTYQVEDLPIESELKKERIITI